MSSASSAARSLELVGLGFLAPLLRLATGEEPRAQLKELWRTVGVPVVAMALFVMLWSFLAARIHTSLGQIPGPTAVWQQMGSLWADHKAEREREAQFYERQRQRHADLLAGDPSAEPSSVRYTGRPTYFDQILTSLRTVFTGFFFATLLAVPIGILCGVFDFFSKLFEPFVDFFRYMPAPTFNTLLVAVLLAGDAPKIALVFIGTVFQMILVVSKTTRLLDPSQPFTTYVDEAATPAP